MIKAPKASDLIKALQDMIKAHGDLQVCLDDPDTGWEMPIGLEKEDIYRAEGNEFDMENDHFVITSCYNGTPDGVIAGS